MSNAGLSKLLNSLGYPFVQTIQLDSRQDVIHLVTWLEDRKVRKLEVKDRDGLRKDSATWDEQFAQYLNVLECPFQWKESIESCTDCLVWLVEFAVAAEYEDCAELCSAEMDSSSATMVIDEDAGSPEAGANITDAEADSIGALMGINRTENEGNAEYLRRISKIVSLYLTSGCREALKTTNSGGVPLEDFPLGFDTGGMYHDLFNSSLFNIVFVNYPVVESWSCLLPLYLVSFFICSRLVIHLICTDIQVNQVATVLKMLHLWDFREMQNDLNSHIVLGQEYTSNPKTNVHLGKVGR